MTRGKSRLAVGVTCALATALVALPAPAAAAVDEYTLNLPNGGSESSEGGSDPATTAPTAVPTYPTTTTTEPLEETAVVTGGGRGGDKRKRQEEELAPPLPTGSANAALGPREIPALRVEDDGDGLPLGIIAIAVLAAACSLLAAWRLRFLRELPAAPRRRAPRDAV
jgi:hypothetical protein